ncbi:MAG: tRNA (adenosine(37)-N6)-threonylcarbamoyltransferase complex transferase subunit TsaD [Proteobacteria bacterium]|nr:tRNA (adenosine(37)-N6)-threonylcarbamoyltransferase complex transferase subunit TsaD [Pseudomonadota bacterium]MBU1686509.1 tRNA (adenosine(37)-N6)-threonylcarbamoyltransferase complex transferase subunit TsaD [Pseudomonadota bacterium]
MILLGIESSCDETAAALLANGRNVLASVINSQIDVHARYGGVVPELASRQHVRNILPVVRETLDQAGITLDQVDGIVVTQGPGLVGCLLVGFSFAKAVSLVRRIPMLGVDHLAGHLLSVFLGDDPPEFPFVAMVASGGHTSLFKVTSHTQFQLVGRTRDDAAGEAFDKVAKLLGLGYPGGPVISRLASDGDCEKIQFPRARLGPGSLDFSFSGLKTAVANHIHKTTEHGESLNIPDVCASFQEAVVDVICEKSLEAARMNQCDQIVLAGGVAANPRLRLRLKEQGTQQGISVHPAPLSYCTDNAAMIAYAGANNFLARAAIAPESDVYSRSPILTWS